MQNTRSSHLPPHGHPQTLLTRTPSLSRRVGGQDWGYGAGGAPELSRERTPPFLLAPRPPRPLVPAARPAAPGGRPRPQCGARKGPPSVGAGDGRSGAGGDPERHRAIRTFGKDLRDQRDAPSVRASPRRGKRGRQRRVGELCLRMAMGQQSPKPRIPPRTAGGAEAVLTEHTILTSPLSPSPAIGVPRRTRSIITPRASPPTEPRPRCQLSGAPVAILKPGMDKTILTRQMSSG